VTGVQTCALPIYNHRHTELKKTKETSQHLVCFLWGQDNRTTKNSTTSLIWEFYFITFYYT